MKELTTEQKAQIYAYKIVTVRFGSNVADKLFPKLKESKESGDEEIRNFISNELACLRATEEKGSDRYEELTNAITWLGKQKAIDVLDEEERVFADNVDSYRKEIDAAYQKGFNEGVKTTLEKYCGQNPTDRAESKFKNGDWCIDNKDGTIFQIVKVFDNAYGYKTIEDKEYTYTHYSLEDDARLWTIQDAKDGDIIYSKHNTESFEWIGIFKSLDKENKRVFFYGFWHDMAKTFSVCGNKAYVLYDDFSPATKEQRDLLFQKMKEAGYLWNFEKKELEKIEQKLDEWIEEYWQHHKVVNPDTYDKGEEIQFDHQGFVRFCKKYCKNHAEWSEEDKGNLLDVKCVIDEVWHNQKIDYSGKELESLWHWLDSIWQRVEYPQDYWKPGKDQMKWLKDVIETVPMNCRQQIPLESLYNDLQKLL